MADPTLIRVRAVAERALRELESRREEVNDLNVFPVADGDTGDNLALTLKAVVDELQRLSDSKETLDEIGRPEIVQSVARAALLGARGNSGVIFSQLVRGAAEELTSRPGELVDPVLIGAAMAKAAERAYASVQEPAEGTILTVIREMAHRLASELAHMPEPRLDPSCLPSEQDAAISEVLESALVAGEDAVKRSPQLLPQLDEAGVVDAGGYGLTIIIAGMVAGLKGTEAPELDHYSAPRPSHPSHSSATFRYCVNFAVTGSGLDQDVARHQLSKLGDSLLVVGDSSTLKVHIHTDDPDAAAAAFHGCTVSQLDVADMRAQEVERASRLGGEVKQLTTGLVAVVASQQMADLFQGVGAHAVVAGRTLNPSTYDLLAAIHAVPAEEVILIPNNSNVFMAAEEAARLSDKRVELLRSRTQQGGLAAAVVYEPERDLPTNLQAMEEALSDIRTAAVAEAARDDAAGRFASGEAVGYLGGELVSWGSPELTLRSVIDQLTVGAELLTCIAADSAPLKLATVGDFVPDGIEVELSTGGDLSHWWLLAAE